MSILRPMVRFHLPFATIEETIYRSVSCYLLAQYFLLKKGKEPDWELEKLAQAYEDIQMINVGMTDRLRSISEEDANANAVVVLDVFAKALPSPIGCRGGRSPPPCTSPRRQACRTGNRALWPLDGRSSYGLRQDWDCHRIDQLSRGGK